jgi:hypothetical protein
VKKAKCIKKLIGVFHELSLDILKHILFKIEILLKEKEDNEVVC